MPRQSKSVEHRLSERTLVVDNGAYSIKAGFATSSPSLDTDCHQIPNCIARSRDKKVWIGAQLRQCQDYGEMVFRRPVEKGYLVNWEAEREIWENSFFSTQAPLKCDPHETNLLLAEAPNCPAALQTHCDQMVFEEFEFANYYRCLGPSLNSYNDIAALTGDKIHNFPAEALLVLDSSYSHTTITPIFQGRPIAQATRRVGIGGKLLTNCMKEIVSVRQTNVIDEIYVMNQVKEDTCFVSTSFRSDMEKTWRGAAGARKKLDEESTGGIVVDYVLPDYINTMRGVTRPHDPKLMAQRNKYGAVKREDGVVETIMTLGNERFCVPELLFTPSDVGMKDAGLAEAVMQSLSALPTGLWPVMLANVLVIGGNVKIAGFVERLTTELRQLAPAECTLRVVTPPDPIKSTWLGGSRLASDPARFKALCVSRQEYLERGSNWLWKRFAHKD